MKLISSKERVKIEKNGEVKEATIVGLDGNGLLCALDESGSMHSLSPDGNSFDIMTGLIRVKK